MPTDTLDLGSRRAREARAGQRIGKAGASLLIILAVLLAGLGGVELWQGQQWGYLLFAPALLAFMMAVWWRWQLAVVPPTGRGLNQQLSREVLARLPARGELSPQELWAKLDKHWQRIFITNHLWIDPQMIADTLSQQPHDLMFVWDKAGELADRDNNPAIEPGHLAVALILTAHDLQPILAKLKLTEQDVMSVADWLDRILRAQRRKRDNFGGIGRDWAAGFTPTLDHFGHNLSASIERYGGQANSLVNSAGVNQIKQAFAQGGSAVALIGDTGIGKTTHVFALAQNVLAETKDRSLSRNQIYELDASTIISSARRPGDMEHIVNTLLVEASHAGNVLLFFDDAQLFFQEGTGAFDATKLLLPAVQNRAVRFIFAMNPRDWQLLKSDNSAFASLLTPVVLQEPNETDVIRSLEDAATRFEYRSKCLIPVETLREAYRLSGRYNQDMAYPGKAISLLEQALAHAHDGVIDASSVQETIEQTTGIKTSAAAPAEADQLLNLEDQIHQRMINQSRAVSVVANALRRARAGVASPNRPIGSFLFLGPTGVGKTELTKAIAATYFGNEANMIRLDMSEYQQDSDVARLLAGGQNETSSLILRVRQQPFSVVLLDEIEKAHPNILNLLLQLLDEGQLTDSTGRPASFKDAVVIATSNAGADTIRQRIEQGQELESFEQEFTDQLINSGQFKPELLNRFDEIVLFRPLTPDELAQVVRLMMDEVNRNLANQNISVGLTGEAIAKIVQQGNDPRLGARPMRRAVQRAVEDTVAQKILRGEVHPGDKITLDVVDISGQ